MFWFLLCFSDVCMLPHVGGRHLVVVGARGQRFLPWNRTRYLICSAALWCAHRDTQWSQCCVCEQPLCCVTGDQQRSMLKTWRAQPPRSVWSSPLQTSFRSISLPICLSFWHTCPLLSLSDTVKQQLDVWSRHCVILTHMLLCLCFKSVFSHGDSVGCESGYMLEHQWPYMWYMIHESSTPPLKTHGLIKGTKYVSTNYSDALWIEPKCTPWSTVNTRTNNERLQLLHNHSLVSHWAVV